MQGKVVTFPYGVECPTCGACAGQKCWTLKAPLAVRTPHPDRIYVAQSEPTEEEAELEREWANRLRRGKIRCKKLRTDGMPCQNGAHENGYCGRHQPREDDGRQDDEN